MARLYEPAALKPFDYTARAAYRGPDPGLHTPAPEPNYVFDYNQLQGTHHPSDLSLQIIRDIRYRYVTVQNSSNRPVGVGVTTYYSGDVPAIRFIAYPGESRHLGINSHDDPPQFLWPLDPHTGLQVGPPQIFARDANDFVLRDGLNGWFVQRFVRPSYRASF